MRKRAVSVTRPTTVARISQRRASASTASRFSGSTIASMRSWLSDVSASTAFMPGSRFEMRATSTSMPAPALAAVSDAAHDSPAAPRSCTPTASLASSSSRHASMSRFSSNGSPTCTDGRLASSPSSNDCEASTLAPPMPSRPVAEPSSTARLPGPSARASTSRSFGRMPRQNTFTSGLPRYVSSNTASPPTVGTPTELP